MSKLMIQMAEGRLPFERIPVILEIIDRTLITRRLVLWGHDQVEVTPGAYLVRVVLPSGEIVADTVTVLEDETRQVLFTPSQPSHERLAWPHFLGAIPTDPEVQDGPSFRHLFPQPWVRLWAVQWSQEEDLVRPLPFRRRRSREVVVSPDLWMKSVINDSRIIGLSVTYPMDESWQLLLQVGSAQVPSRLILLPPLFRRPLIDDDFLEILIYPGKDIGHPLNRGLSVSVVSGRRLILETILHYVSSGELEYARSIVEECFRRREEEIWESTDAMIASYFMPPNEEMFFLWGSSRWFSSTPDGYVINARRKQSRDRLEDVLYKRKLFLEAARAGIPRYKEGVRRLIDGLELVASIEHREDHEVTDALRFVRSYAGAMDWTQQLTTFYGAHPLQPELNAKLGLPDNRGNLLILS